MAASKQAFDQQMRDVQKGTRSALTGRALEYAQQQGLDAQGKSTAGGLATGKSGIGDLSSILREGNEEDVIKEIYKKLNLSPADFGHPLLPLAGTGTITAKNVEFFKSYGIDADNWNTARAQGAISVNNQGGWSSLPADVMKDLLAADPRVAQAMNEALVGNAESYGQTRILYNTDGTKTQRYVPDSMTTWTRAAWTSICTSGT